MSVEIPNKLEFLHQGGLILRNTPNISNQRYLWLDIQNKELRWSTDCKPGPVFKRVALSHIQKISRIFFNNSFGFQIDTRNHNIKFWNFSQLEREKWYICLQSVSRLEQEPCPSPFIADENQGMPTPQRRRRKTLPSLILSQPNGQGCSRDLFKKTNQGVILQKLAEIVQAQSIQDLPSRLEEVLESQENQIKQTQNKLKSLQPSREVAQLNQQVNTLQKRIEQMDQERQIYTQKIETLNSLQSQYHKQQEILDHLSAKMTHIEREIDKSKKNYSLYRTELEFLSNQNDQLLPHATENESPFNSLFRGFKAEVKKRGMEFEEKLVSVSNDFSSLVMRPLQFNPFKQELSFNSITCLFQHAETQNGRILLSIHNLESPIVIAVPEQNSHILTQIGQSFQKYKKQHSLSVENQLVTQFKSSCQYLAIQICLEDRLAKTYKKNLTKSICQINNMGASHSIYQSELRNLAQVTSDVISTPLSTPAVQYLSNERPEIIQQLVNMNSEIAEIFHSIINNR